MTSRLPRNLLLRACVAAGLFTSVTGISAQVVITQGPQKNALQIGSSNPVTADPPVRHPDTQPCTVQLFTSQAFADFTNKTFAYAPPSACPGPWAKVVFSADFTVTAGRQFDRTAQFLIGNMNIYYGTTAEPRATLSPSWHVESDITDLSAGLKAAQQGQAILGNIVNSTYTGIIYANAKLDFYPAEDPNDAPRVADLVVPLPNAPGGAATLNNTASLLSQSVTLPRNAEQLYLDVFAQSQSSDEFDWTCVPSDVAAKLFSCGNTAFRETEITIDGKPAGIAPIYPWIYTGGVDPYLWEPIPGVQTLNFKPFRVNLTPFAGTLTDGAPHTVALSVYNANNYFLATANLLVFTDPHARQTNGQLTQDTLSAAPIPTVAENLNTDSSGNITGTVGVTSQRKYTISGWITTSHGRVETTVDASVNFSNNQNFIINATQYVQDITQGTQVDVTTTIEQADRKATDTQHSSYPLHFKYDQETASDGSISIASTSNQVYRVNEQKASDGETFFSSSVSNNVKAQDTDLFDASFNLLGHANQASTQVYNAKDSTGYCYDRTITAANNVLTSVADEDCN
jgi:hypothetical protein